MILYILIAMFAGWLQRHQQQTIACLLEENRILKLTSVAVSFASLIPNATAWRH